MRVLRWTLGLSALIGLVAVARVGGQGLPQFLMYGVYNGAPKPLAVDASGNLNISASISGADGAILDGVTNTIKATVLDLVSSNPLTVAIVDSGGAQISSFGGGTQYATGSAQATPTGTVALGWDGTNVRALAVNASGQLQVVFPSAQAVSQSGSWSVSAAAAFPVTDNSGSLTVDAPVGTPVFVRLSDGAAAIATLPVSLATVPSHDVTNAGTFAVQAAQSGTWNIRNQDGTGNALTSATRGSERALSVQIVDGSGAQITSFGGSGGTASNFTSAFPASGTAAGFSDGTNMQGARVFDGDTGAGTQYVLGAVLRKTASGGTVEAGTSTDPLRVDPTGTTTQPVSYATTGNGTATGALRVSLASDSTGQVTLATGANTIGSLAANQSVNVAQINGVTTTMGNGISGTGVQRVTIASDSTGQVTLAAGSNTIGALTANQSVNVAQINGVTPLMGNGASGTGAQRVTIANDSTGVLATVSTVTTLSQFGGNAINLGNGTVGTGTLRVALASDTSSNTNPLYASAVGTSSTAAASGCYLVSAASTNSTSCKGSAGNLYGFRFINTTTTVYYLRMYNTAAAPTCSSATGFIESIPIPPAGAAGQAGGFVEMSDIPINYGTGIGFCLTGGSSSTDNTNAATGVFGKVVYK